MILLGAPATGEEFYDREELMGELETYLPSAHHALVGPRRCGKSSLLKELMRRNIGDFVPVYIDIRHVVPRSNKRLIEKLGEEVLYAIAQKEGLLKAMPKLVRNKMASLADFIRDNLKVKISDWLTIYFEPSADLTELIKRTFNTIESYGTKLLVMFDEITSLIRLSGVKLNKEDLDFMWALREYFLDAKNARYIISGSQTGIMEILLAKEIGPFVGSFVMKRVGPLEEKGADDLIASKIESKVSPRYIKELKERTRLWPLYLQAYCLATNNHKGRLESISDIEDEVFGLLNGHFLYLEGQLSENELRVLVKMGIGAKTNDLSNALGLPYYTTQTILRRLELKGFAKKIAAGTYEPFDHVFKEWLRREYLTEK